jgi:DNA primase
LSLAGLSSPVFYNADLLQESPTKVYICEGAIDTLSAMQMGLPALGVFGVTRFRDEWFNGFRSVREVCLLFDNDDPGRAAAAKLCARFRLRGIKAESRSPKHVNDMNDLLQLKQKDN